MWDDHLHGNLTLVSPTWQSEACSECWYTGSPRVNQTAAAAPGALPPLGTSLSPSAALGVLMSLMTWCTVSYQSWLF